MSAAKVDYWLHKNLTSVTGGFSSERACVEMLRKIKRGLAVGVTRDDEGMEEERREQGRDVSRGTGAASRETPKKKKEPPDPQRAFKYTYDVAVPPSNLERFPWLTWSARYRIVQTAV